MGLRLRTNMASLNGQRRLENTTRRLTDSSGKLSSGKRINKAADDSAGLAISENLRADIRSLHQAKRNALDGISMVQTAEGGLTETSTMLVRLRELAVQSSSDTIGREERLFIDKEYIALKDEIDRIANSTEYNGTRLLIGRADDISGEYDNPPDLFPTEIQVGKDYFAEADAIGDRNPVNIIKIDFQNMNSFTTGEGSLDLGRAQEGTRVEDKYQSQAAISKLDDAITKVNDYRAYLGSIQNRLGSTVRNLSVQTENLSDAKSRIQDTDYAQETAKFTQEKILQQAGTSILSTSNQQPMVAMQLIQGLG
ncbi:MAG: flagellin FliC [Zetaproteobacteria bacterium]|nr:flagellin FliC [Pseudobdellovibrionaceae bacterium]